MGHRDCTWAVLWFSERAAELCLALDGTNRIFEAYSTLETHLVANEATKTFIDQFLKARNKRQRVSNAVLNDSERQWLADELKVKEPVEPELIAVGKAAPGRPIVVVVGEAGLVGTGIRRRATNTPDVIDRLHAKYKTLCICPVKTVRQQLDLLQRSRHPGTEEELIAFIAECETEFLEFKQPHEKDSAGKLIPTTRLTKKRDDQPGIVAQALKAVCAMINCEGGVVFIGITPEGQILGVDPPAITASGKPDDDTLCDRFADEFWRLKPPVNQYVKPSVIPLSNGRRVVALHVTAPKNGIRYSFYDGREWAVYDRCGPSNRKTQVISDKIRKG